MIREAPGADAVIDFWLDEVGPDRWYVADEAVDAEARRRFQSDVKAARGGKFEKWALTPRGALALLILLDQLPRNIWRGEAEAYASDAQAVRHATRSLMLGHDLKTPEPERQFFYMPLMHAENLAAQDRCVRLVISRLPEVGAHNLPHAVAHREIIRKFGRFPYRNRALGRQDTPDEAAWLAAGGYRV